MYQIFDYFNQLLIKTILINTQFLISPTKFVVLIKLLVKIFKWKSKKVFIREKLHINKINSYNTKTFLSVHERKNDLLINVLEWHSKLTVLRFLQIVRVKIATVSRKIRSRLNNSRRESSKKRGGSTSESIGDVNIQRIQRANPRESDRSRFPLGINTVLEFERPEWGGGGGEGMREETRERNRENNELFLTSPLREFRALGKSREHIAFILALFTWRKVISRESTIFRERCARGKWNFNDCRQSQSSTECNYCWNKKKERRGGMKK